MERRDFLSSLFWLFLAIYVLIESVRLGLGNWMIPGPGLFPFGAAVLLLVTSAVTCAASCRKADRQIRPVESPERLRWQNVILVLIAMLFYSLFLQGIGFVPCTFCIVFLFLRGIAGENWLKALVVAFMVTVGSYLLFKVFLGADLPRGMFFL